MQARYGEHPHLGHVWITPTVLRAGEPVQMNVMPADASVWLDVRTIPAVDHADARRRGDRAWSPRRREPSASAPTSTVIDDRPAVATAEDDPLVRAAVGRPRRRRPATPPRLGGVPGATDGTVITSRAGMPSVVYGPGGKWIAHQADEFVEVDDLVAHAEVYVEAADRFLRPLMWEALVPAGPGPANDITDVERHRRRPPPAHRSRLAHRHDGRAARQSAPSAASTSRGGGPGTRETDLLHPANMVEQRRRHLPHRRQRLRARRRRRRDGRGSSDQRPRASGSAPSRTTSCRSCRPPSCSTSMPAATFANRPDATFGARATERGVDRRPVRQGTRRRRHRRPRRPR